ncbi:hypothetical protein ACSBIB_004720 [Escherichia coli]
MLAEVGAGFNLALTDHNNIAAVNGIGAKQAGTHEQALRYATTPARLPLKVHTGKHLAQNTDKTALLARVRL